MLIINCNYRLHNPFIDSDIREDLSGKDYSTTVHNPKWYNSNWTKRVIITIQCSKVSEDLQDFPVYIDLGDLSTTNFFSDVDANGIDIVVTEQDGTTKVLREVVRVSKSTSEGELWFKATNLSSTENTSFYLYYGNSSASETNATDVWDTNFLGVWHMDDDPGASNINDSTTNGFNGTPQVSMDATDLIDSQVGKGVDFDGIDDFVTFGDIASFDNLSQLTITLWVNVNPLEEFVQFVTKMWDSDGLTNGFALQLGGILAGGSDEIMMSPRNNEYWHVGRTNTNPISAGSWYHIVMVFDGPQTLFADRLRCFINGVEFTGLTYTSTLPNVIGETGAPLQFAHSDGEAEYLDGKLDEIHISKIPRSDGWIIAEFNNQYNPGTFYSIGIEEIK